MDTDHGSEIWRRRRGSFSAAAGHYADHRPGYPVAAIEQVLHASSVRPGDTILEIGCGPGPLTFPLARRGFAVHAVELGEAMAQRVRAGALAEGLPITVDVGPFEDWTPPRAFPLVVAAASFHWIPPEVRLHRVAAALVPGGTVALLWNRHVSVPADRGFFSAVQADYRAVGLDPRSVPPTADALDLPYAREILTNGKFGPVTTYQFPHQWHLTAAQYVALMDTYSDHHILTPAVKAELIQRITRRIEGEYGGYVVRGVSTVLYLAQRRGVPELPPPSG